MSSIPPKGPPATSVHGTGKGHDAAFPSELDRALKSKDVADLNVHLYKVKSGAHEKPEALQKTFGQLHALLTKSAQTGAPLQHKDTIAKFLQTTGRERLETLTKDILDPKDPSRFQRDVAEAKSLLAAGYGGKDTAKLTSQVNMRSFGSSSTDKAETTKGNAKEGGSSLKNALTSARKGFSLLGQSARKIASEGGKKGKTKSSGGEEA